MIDTRLPWGAVSGDGQVLATVHGMPGAVEAQQVWRALGEREPGHAARH